MIDKEELKIQETKTVWVAWTNTDLTEGRGQSYPKAVCEKEATAIRLGHKGSVMGSNCHVTAELAVKVSGRWLYPARLHTATTEDSQAQASTDAKRAAIEKAKAAGLTDDDIKALVNL